MALFECIRGTDLNAQAGPPTLPPRSAEIWLTGPGSKPLLHSVLGNGSASGPVGAKMFYMKAEHGRFGPTSEPPRGVSHGADGNSEDPANRPLVSHGVT